MQTPTANIQKLPRNYMPKQFAIQEWKDIEPYFVELENRAITSLSDLQQWMLDVSEVEAILSEEACWRQIKMTCDTENEALQQAFSFFVTQIQPSIQPFADRLNKKLLNSAFVKELDADLYFTYLRSVQKNIDLYREENITLQAEIGVMQQQFGAISGKMTVTIKDQEYTLQQAAKFLENPDRKIREEAYIKIQERRLQDKEQLTDLFNNLLQKRNKVATQAGFTNYRDYRFVELGRFDYKKEDCFQFHKAVKQHVMPIVDEIYKTKKKQLSLEKLKPWDLDAEPLGIEPLKPFENGEELLEKTINCFNALHPFFGECLTQMKKMGHLDLESRKGKSPGGYNCPLAESGAPFIFMNAAGQMDDVTTMVHEGGHAVHSFLTHPLPLSGFKEYPMEIAEVASMSMELFSMDHWHLFFDDNEKLKRAKQQQLERVITIFPWIATIDKFQHWIYENPNHTVEERKENWKATLAEYTSSELDVEGLEAYRSYSWQRQLHLFEVPFYYIEYGIAQLGAIGMWMQYKKNPQTALENYIQALSLGGTKTLPALFASAGLPFDFSPSAIESLMLFVKKEMQALA